MRADSHRRRGFTLIELLVVVAIIALLVAILLPSLNRARKQARTTLCASRIGQLTKSIFLYAEAFNETPPFLGRGYENIRTPQTRVYRDPGCDNQTGLFWARLEDWLMPGMPDWWASEESTWPANARISNGSLFSYARFENIYRCPEFEQRGVGRKSQNVFNYTRGITARKCWSKAFPEDGTQEALTAGPIMKFSNVYSPSTMWLMFDEQWDFHCAIPIDQWNPNGKAGPGLLASNLYNFLMGIETIQCIAGDVLGSYHATAGKAPGLTGFRAIRASEMGSLSCYDGHVDLFRDPIPTRDPDPAATQSDLFEALGPAAEAMGNLMIEQIFAQRGANMDPVTLVQIFQ
jgi:prepilin-type N-terminal cleavage/methylation domain-containing protein